MHNPFSYTKIVSGPSFCNREKEIKELSSYIINSQNVLLYSNRRIGKSSLLLRITERLKSKRKFLYVDLYGTLSEMDFVSAVFKSLRQLESNLDKLFNVLKGPLSSLSMTLSVDPNTSLPTISPGFVSSQKAKFLEDAFGAIIRLSNKEPLCVIFDEFPEVAEYTELDFEKRLRSIIQTHKEISYVFSGSKRHTLLRMFSENKRAFFKQAEPYQLFEIDKKHYVKWVKGLFSSKNVHLKDDFIFSVVSVCESHPMYVQRFFFHLWEEKKIEKNTIYKIMELILQRQEGEFLAIWDSLTLNQKKVLKLILKTGGTGLFSAEALSSVQLKTGSQIEKAIEFLVRMDIVIKNDAYHFQDLMFKYWLKQRI